MEFRFRAGEGRAPSIIPRPGPSIQDPGLFAPQSLHGGLGAVYGREIERDMDMRLHPHRALGALRRELIKGQIREDIIAREMSERRILEEEVMREMEMERVMGIRRVPLVEQLVLGPPMPMPMPEVMMAERLLPGPSMRHLEVRVQEDLPPLQFNRNVRFRNEPAFVHDGGEVESGRKEPDFVDAGDNLEEEEEQSPVSKVPVLKAPVSKVKLSHPKVSGIKRKGAAVIGSKKVARGQQNLTCTLCLVSVNSEDGFNDHLKGKKHQAKVTRLTLEDNGTSNGSAAPTPNKAGAMSPQYVLEPGMKRMTMMVDGKSHQVVKKKSFLWCEPCAVRCNSTAMMVSHLGGKKHLVQVGEINSQGKPAKEEGVSGEEVNESGAESEAME